MSLRPVLRNQENWQKLPVALVVGGAGFVGSHLVDALLQKNCFVYCLDKPLGKDSKRLLKVFHHRQFRFLEYNPKKPFLAVKDLVVDFVFHLTGFNQLGWGLTESIELARKQRAKFLLLAGQLNTSQKKPSQKLVSNYFSHYDLDCRIVKLIDVFGPSMLLHSQLPLNGIFLNWKKYTTLKIPGEGSELVYPIYIDDAVRGILKAMFTGESKGKVFVLAGKQQSILEFSYTLSQDRISGLGAEFTKSKKISQEKVLKKEIKETQRQLHFQPKIPLKRGVRQTISWINQSSLLPGLQLPGKKSMLLKFLVIFLLFFGLLSLPLSFLAFYYVRSMSQAAGLAQALNSFDWPKLEERLELTDKYLQKGTRTTLKLNPWFSVFGLQKQANHLFAVFDTGQQLTKVSRQLIDLEDNLDQLAGIVFNQKTGDYYQSLEQVKFNLDQLWDKVNSLEVSPAAPEFNLALNQLLAVKQDISLGRECLKILPSFLAFNEQKTYLILLQNNLELRPTGGKIAGFGLLTFEKGRFLDFQAQPALSTDSLLLGKNEPPPALKKYLTNNWTFQDSNWSPHFPSSASQAEWFLSKGLKKTFSGTLALDLNFFQKILTVLGPVQLGKELITSDNLISVASAWPEENPDFLIPLSQAVAKQLQLKKDLNWLKLLKNIKEALQEKSLVLSLADPKTNEIIRQFGWDASIRNLADQASLVTDYLMLNEANLGLNKANFVVSRKIFQHLNLDKDGISATTTITYINKSAVHIKENYLNYLRLYLPSQAQILGVKLGPAENELKTVPSDQVDLFEEFGKKAIGLMVEVPADREQVVEIRYRIAKTIVAGNEPLTYAFFWQKQPGMTIDPLEITVKVAADWQILETSPQAVINNNQALLETTTSQDKTLTIKIGQ